MRSIIVRPLPEAATTDQTNSRVSPEQLSAIARRLGSNLSFPERLLFQYRPSICPFHMLLEQVPQGSRILDVGCGNGLWLLLLAELKRISAGTGIEITRDKIAIAQGLAKNFQALDFKFVPADESWPEGDFNVLSVIDVLHHVPRNEQRRFFERVRKTRVEWILFKDIDPGRSVRRRMNTLHDMLLARQIPAYCDRETVVNWLRDIGFRVRNEQNTNMLWYGHYMILASRE